MKISRRGSSADHGTSAIELNAPTINWTASDKCLNIKQAHIRDFNTKSHHGYTIKISLTEVAAIISALAQAAQKDPVIFEKELESSLKGLCQLQAIVAGLKSTAQSPN